MRTLASVQKIANIREIAGADNIAVADVLGWEVVIRKEDFQVGDKCVYIETDSIMPVLPQYEFLKQRKYRIRTIKLKGQVSQGLCLPLSSLGSGSYSEGDDVTEIMKIRKYDPEGDKEARLQALEDSRNKNRIDKYLKRFNWYRRFFTKAGQRGWPAFIKKTDEERIQKMPWICDQEKGTEFIFTEKLDGCLGYRTYIQTDHGLKSIANIVKNMLPVRVLSYNEKTGETELKPIIDYHRIKANRKAYKIGVGHRGKGNRPKFIECTDNHKFLTPDGWKRADELQLSDTLMHSNKNISNELKEIFIGCLLGDSSLNSNTKTDVYRTIHFSHSMKQKEYFNYKKRLFGDLFIEQKNKISGYGSTMKVGILRSNLSIQQFINEYCGKEGQSKKEITEKMANEITPLSLAFWFMDDGCLQNREKENMRCRATINSQGFSYKEHLILQAMLMRKFNIDVTIGDAETYKGNILQFDVEGTEKLCSLIAPYVCKSMKYKLPIAYKDSICFFENKTFNTKNSILKTKIISIESWDDPNKFGGYLYDLTVADNKNYFANSILVHNCSATYALLRLKKRFWQFKDRLEFIVCSRNVNLRTPDNSSYWRIAKQCDIESVLRKLITTKDEFIILQGEIIGIGIQSNKYKIDGIRFYAFNLIHSHSGADDYKTMRRSLAENNISTVTVVERGQLGETIHDCVNMAKGLSDWCAIPREGLVVRNHHKRISFKIINPDFLLKFEEADEKWQEEQGWEKIY
jgi:hypothetical protein